VAVRVTLVLCTVPLAIIANIIRITLTAAAAYYLGPWTLGTFYHKFSGTMTFLTTFFLLTLLDQALALVIRWRRR
jgi:exosortase/archaeosortase family protein